MLKLFKNRVVLPPEEKKNRRRENLYCAISGILAGVSFPPFNFPYLMLIAFIPYIIVLEKRNGLNNINKATYIFGFFFTLVSLYWVGSWTKETDPFLMISGVSLIFFNPVTFMIPATLYSVTKKYIPRIQALYFLPVFWVFYEYVYSATDLRFPWLVLGHGIAKAKVLIQAADIIGASGLTALILIVNILIYGFVIKKIKNHLIILITVLTIWIVYGFIRLNQDFTPVGSFKAGIVQPNFNPWNKWDGGSFTDQLDVFLEMSKQTLSGSADVVIWPESALPGYLLAGAYDEEVSRIRNFIDSNKVFLLTGMPDATFYFNEKEAPPEAKTTQSGYKYTSYNSILGFSPGVAEVQKYRKVKLVPFGELVPFSEHLSFLDYIFKWNVGISSWNIGQDQNIITFRSGNKSIKVGAVNCIESIYQDFVAGFVQNGAEVLVVVTNDSWYGYSPGPFQHKDIATLRAVENRRNFIRCANGGISTIIDEYGNSHKELPLFTRGIINGEVKLIDYKTFYSQYPLLLQYLSVLIVLLITVYSIFLKLKTRGK